MTHVGRARRCPPRDRADRARASVRRSSWSGSASRSAIVAVVAIVIPLVGHVHVAGYAVPGGHASAPEARALHDVPALGHALAVRIANRRLDRARDLPGSAHGDRDRRFDRSGLLRHRTRIDHARIRRVHGRARRSTRRRAATTCCTSRTASRPTVIVARSVSDAIRVVLVWFGVGALGGAVAHRRAS